MNGHDQENPATSKPKEPQQVGEIAEVAITGSPNSVTTINFDVRSTHLRTPILGTMLTLHVPIQGIQGPEELLVLGQVAKIETQNRWHEDQSLKNFIKLRGPLPHLTEIGDITTGALQIVGAYRSIKSDGSTQYEKTRLPVPPGSGLPLSQVDEALIRALMNQDFGYGFLGNFYGMSHVPAPIYVRHFGDFGEHGSGEAYMGGVFGPSGSGKSVIAATLLSLWSHNPKMGILILDPASEFSENAFARGTSFTYDFHQLLGKISGGRFDPSKHRITLDQLQLEGASMFAQVLAEKEFFAELGVGAPKVMDSADKVARLLDDLEDSQDWNTNLDWNTLSSLQVPYQGNQVLFSTAITSEAAAAYAGASRQSYAQTFLANWQSRNHILSQVWNETVELFSQTDSQGNPRVSVKKVLEDTVLKGQIRILDLNPQKINMSQRFKLYLMDFVFKRLRTISYAYYKQNKPGNCLIVLDEAGRYIPQDPGDDDQLKSLCKKLTDSVKEMRKMRCGFMFITQTIAEIQKEIFRNLHFRIYGVGLGVGADADHIRAREGDEAFELYKSLPDPRLSGTFSFMVAGVLLALGSSGRPMVIEGFPSGQSVIDANQHLIQSSTKTSLTHIGHIVS